MNKVKIMFLLTSFVLLAVTASAQEPYLFPQPVFNQTDFLMVEVGQVHLGLDTLATSGQADYNNVVCIKDGSSKAIDFKAILPEFTGSLKYTMF